jgi:hypothetical protein
MSCIINLLDTTRNSPFVTIAPANVIAAPANVIADQTRLIVLNIWTGPSPPQQAQAVTAITTTEMAVATPTSRNNS